MRGKNGPFVFHIYASCSVLQVNSCSSEAKRRLHCSAGSAGAGAECSVTNPFGQKADLAQDEIGLGGVGLQKIDALKHGEHAIPLLHQCAAHLQDGAATCQAMQNRVSVLGLSLNVEWL